jgi:hypothetical protein
MKEQSHYFPKLWLAILLISVAGVHAIAQDRVPSARVTNDHNRTYDDIYLVTVTVNLGPKSRAVSLAREHFALSDNGIRQDIPFFTRIQPDSGNNDVIYLLGYHPPIWLFDGKRRKVKVVIHDATGKKLKARFSPTEYPGTYRNPDAERIVGPERRKRVL